MIGQTILESSNSTASPSDQIYLKEFIEGVQKAGSLIAMLENKKINTTALLTLLLEKTDYQDFFTEITSSESFREAIMSLLFLNPNLVRSKITKSLVKKINGKSNYKFRKTSIQQTPSSIQKRKKQAI